ncbi:MAG: transglutaminase-like domain-containing protein [Alphaproteobacteria bacterium]|nr:transglutaminase-like domain-containing protein [Alphaproteobacteria bacterium]
MSFDPQAYLATLAESNDAQIDLGMAALAIGLLAQPGVSAGRFLHHLQSLGSEVAARFDEYRARGEEDSVLTRLASLKDIIVLRHGYVGDQERYDDLQNANLVRVIERRKGLPIALCILAIHAARACSWHAEGLLLPGHVLVRLDHDGKRLIFDPFDSCKIMEAPDLRALMKRLQGPQAELSAQYYIPADNRDLLLRLQNNIKFRQIESEDYDGALKTVAVMRLIAPGDARLLLDEGVLYARLGQHRAAIFALEDYLSRNLSPQDRHDALLLLRDLRTGLQ